MDELGAAHAPSMFSPSASGEAVTQFVDSLRAFSASGFRAMPRAGYEDQAHVLAEVAVPTPLLFADHDVRAPVAVGEAMHAAIRGSRLVVLHGPGRASPVAAISWARDRDHPTPEPES